MNTYRVKNAFGHLVDRWRDYRAAIADLRELADLDPDTVATIAAECGLSSGELREIVTHGSRSESLMERMMAAHGLEPDRLRQEMPAVMRDIELLCARCVTKGRCSRELEAGTAAQNAAGFCPNADTFEALIAPRVA